LYEKENSIPITKPYRGAVDLPLSIESQGLAAT